MSPKKPEFVGSGGGGGLGDMLDGIKPPSMPGRAKVLFTVVLMLFIVTGFLYSMFLEYVRPNEFGIKEVQIGVNRGIQEKVYEPGLAFVMPFGFQKIHRLPRHVQVLELTQMLPNRPSTAAPRSEYVYHDRPAKIQTSDGFFVDVDVSILYRIVDPYKVVTTLGAGQQYLHQGMLPKAEPFLKQTLGELTTEEFYNSPMRVEKANRARDLLSEEMEPLGIQVDQVLIRYFHYTDAIQQNIEAKKLQDQLVFTNQSKKKAAMEEQQLERVRKEGEMQVAITMEEGQAYKVTKEAERDLYVRTKKAEADLLSELAMAVSTELENEAMQVLGADRKVALEMAKVMSGLEVIVMPSGGAGSMNPLDLDEVLEVFGVEEYMEGSEAAGPGPPPRDASPPPAAALILQQTLESAREAVEVDVEAELSGVEVSAPEAEATDAEEAVQ